MSEPDLPRRALPWRPFVIGMVLALGIGYALRPHAGRETPPAAPAAPVPPSASAPPAVAPPAPAPPAAPAGPPRAKAGGTLQLDRASFPASGAVHVSLELPVASTDDEPRPVRLISQPDHRILQVRGKIESGRGAAAIDVDQSYLQPGTYLVEVETTEQSHFPLRRYFIIVR
jgi:hypothetical protein